MSKHTRYIRRGFLVGWEAQEKGLLLLYSNGQRDFIEMPHREAFDNSFFLTQEVDRRNPDDVIGITWWDYEEEDITFDMIISPDYARHLVADETTHSVFMRDVVSSLKEILKHREHEGGGQNL